MAGGGGGLSAKKVKSLCSMLFYHRAEDQGRTFSGLIQSFVAACGPLNKEFLPLYETDAGKKVYQETLDAVQHNFPQYIKELQGTADGSKLFLLHMDDILPNVLAQRSSNNTNGCSTVCCNYPGQFSSLSPTLTLLAHQSWSQLARPCSKLADQSLNPQTHNQLARPCSKLTDQSPKLHTPTKLKANWPDPVSSLLTSLSTLTLPANQAGSQLARPCSKLADQPLNPHTPSQPSWEPTGQTLLLTNLPTLTLPPTESQLAKLCSKIADQSPNPHTPTKLRVNWPDCSKLVVCTQPGFSWSSTQPLPGYSGPGVHHSVELLGHTEDALAETLNHIYFVSAHIISEEPQGRWNVTEERFMSLCYAGHLPGFTMSYNHHGLVFSVNIIMAKTLAAGKTPRHFLTRALLASENFVQAQQVLRDAGCGSGDGASINMTFLNQEGDRLFHNAEVGPACGGAKESPLNILTASPHEHMFHANKYLRLQVPQHDGNIVSSSDRRQAAFMRLPEPRSKRDMEIILGDQSDKEFSIFRESGDNDYVKTVAVGIFDCVERTWSIYADNPKTNDPIVVLPLLLKCVER
uniref:Peptidase C45 hydrolase domain-containing protein n=1 Tax=Timema tahoe TaxID=61484 RepID=A0A7R9IG30_9NEOP|nr:unnamed protein product [Timema tahoe]